MVQITLPYPPTVNTYWRHPTKGKLAGRHLISEDGRKYRDSVVDQVRLQLGNPPRLEDRLSVEVEVWVPDKRRRDLDNLSKSLFDALTHAGLWVDDSQIDRMMFQRMPVGGFVKVTVNAL